MESHIGDERGVNARLTVLPDHDRRRAPGHLGAGGTRTTATATFAFEPLLGQAMSFLRRS